MARKFDLYLWNVIDCSASSSGSFIILHFIALIVLIQNFKICNIYLRRLNCWLLQHPSYPTPSFCKTSNRPVMFWKQDIYVILKTELWDKVDVKLENTASVNRNSIRLWIKRIYVLLYWVWYTNKQTKHVTLPQNTGQIHHGTKRKIGLKKLRRRRMVHHIKTIPKNFCLTCVILSKIWASYHDGRGKIWTIDATEKDRYTIAELVWE